jgi:hypothetical protein
VAVAFTEITAVSQYDNANNTIFSSPVLTAVANRLYVLKMGVSYSSATPRTLSSVAGGGLGTWNIVGGCSVENTSQTRRLETAWAWLSSPAAAAAIDITWSGGTTGCAYSLWEITGFNTATPIGQTGNNRSTGATSLIPALGSGTVGSGILAACQTISNEAMSAEAGWTAGENHTGINPNTTMLSAYRTDVSDLGCTFSWTTSGTAVASILEILAAAASGNAPRAMHHMKQQGMS